MSKNGPIIVIEDDNDDQVILMEIFKKLNLSNEIIYFYEGHLALEYLNKAIVTPFLILSDINMPKINGFELRAKIRENEKLSIRCIPYLFFTTGTSKQTVSDAYEMSVQGFFIKPISMKALENTLRKIIDYWEICISPGGEFD